MVKALQDGPAHINGFAADAWSWGVMMWEGALLLRSHARPTRSCLRRIDK